MYENWNTGFWTKKRDELFTVGDHLGRLPAINLINPQADEIILDAGCGAGFISRRLAWAEAKVWGCDLNRDMVEKANFYEEKDKLNISYAQADIASLPYENDFFDKVACIAVLMHSSPDEYTRFLLEAFRVLRPGGKLIISITHPDLYYTHKSREFWANFSPLEKKHWSKSGLFKEMYQDIHGDELVCEVWRHPKKFLLDAIRKNFTVEHTQSTYLTEKVLRICNQRGRVGSACFYQIVARKKY